MIVFPNAKINLGLNITSKREDGYHDLESVFYPVPWKDVLEIIPSDKTEMTFSGIPIEGKAKDNLCMKVYEIVKDKLDVPPVKIHLHKNIPIGAGLGGGSSDAAFTLKLLNEMFSLKLSTNEMESLIRPLGADCAFFIQNKPVLAIEKGDKFNEVSLSLSGKYLIMIYPDLFISTKEAYGTVKPQIPEESLTKALDRNISEWKDFISNDFEKALIKEYPVLENVKVSLYNAGAIYASMTGSGSTVYGIFDEEVKVSENFPSIYSIWQGYLK